MDTNNLQNPTPSNSNTDLDSKYQEILDKYATELSQQTPGPQLPPPPEPEPLLPPPEKILKPVLPQLPPLPPKENPTPIAPIYNDPDSLITPPIPPTPPQNNIVKVLFFISLIIFLTVAGGVVYTLSKGQNKSTGITPDSTLTPPDVNVSPTSSATADYCLLNDKKYAVNETFAAADGCNTCSCLTDLTIACTEKDCISVTPTLTPKPVTPTLKPSAKKPALPAAILNVIVADAIKSSTREVTKSMVTIGEYQTSGDYYQVALGVCYEPDSCPGYIVWVTKINSIWTVVASGQEPPKCSVLAKYNFPTQFSCNP